ncbi:MAG: hypothetical protein ACFB2X_07295 [Rivularia sp. (in: cyanobacteria)]
MVTNTSIISILRPIAQNQPDKTVYIFLIDGEKDSVSLTYQELD